MTTLTRSLPRGRTYSPARLRLVLALLTLVTLPAVLGSAFLIYHYFRFGVMVDRRLRDERSQIPSRLYARPLTLRTGVPLAPADVVRVLNALRYEQRPDVAAAGQFAPVEDGVVLWPRPGGGAAAEPVGLRFKNGRLVELRGLRDKRRYESQTLEPVLITSLYDEARQKRRLVRYEDLPQHLVQAVLAIEDRRFFSHAGLDPIRIVAAALRNIEAESVVQGGSTITQQLVKNFFLTPERTLRRKVQEALLAFVLERRAEKKDIFEMYVNAVYLGQVGSFSIQGVGQAARLYFGKDVANLTLPESALIAGLIQSPNPYNPYRHPQRALARRDQVLRAMADAGFLAPAALEAALAEPLHVERPRLDTSEAPYFVDLVRSQLEQRYTDRDLITQNLSIHTSLDLRLQDVAQRALAAGLQQVEDGIKKKRTRQPLQGALIALEPRTGAVLALVGGRSYATSQYNRAFLARRQPGSTFKPFVYLAAFEATFDDPALPPITTATVVDDSPSVFFYGDKEYIPQNYEDEYLGHVTLRRALAKSLNVATVKVAEMVGYSRVAELWSKKLGIGEIQPYPALALGSFEATPLEMATAYNTLANGGLKVDPVTILRVENERGQVYERYKPPTPRRVVHEESAFLLTSMLESVINEGSGIGARSRGFNYPAAGKTGTTNDMRDAWFAGYTPELLCVVWVGYDDNTPINLPGSRAALPIWVEFMKAALAGTEPEEFPVPAENIVFVEIDKETGLLATPYCPTRLSEAFIAGTEPMEPCFYHLHGY